MIARDDLINFIHEILTPTTLTQALSMDEMANGIQIHGNPKVTKVALGVSLNQQFLDQAVEWGSEFCIFHHGFDVSTHKSLYPTYSQTRLITIFQHNLTIAAYHAALDIQPEFGNNASIARRLNAKVIDTYYEGWGVVATFPKPKPLDALIADCKHLFQHEIIDFSSGPKHIKTVGICSGGSKPYAEHIFEMHQKSIDLHLSGESTESAPYKMIDSGINYLVCGHYATEVFGVQNLGTKIKKHFGSKIKTKFIDVPNPI